MEDTFGLPNGVRFGLHYYQMGLMYRAFLESKWYPEFRGFQKNFCKIYLLKEKPDVKSHILYKFGPKILKNVHYLGILYLNRQRMLDNQMAFSGKNTTI